MSSALQEITRMTAAGDDSVLGKHPAYLWTMTSLCIIATFLNIAMIVTSFKSRSQQSSVNIFLGNLGVGGLVLAAVVEPLYFWVLSKNRHAFYGDNVTCKVLMFIPLVSVCLVIYTMVAIAIDTYRSIVSQIKLDVRGAITTVGVIWILSVVVSIPQLYEYNAYIHREADNVTYKECGSEGIVEHFETVYASVVFMVAFFIPLLIMSVCYGRIIMYVYKTSNVMNKYIKTDTSNIMNKYIKTDTKTVAAPTTFNRNILARKVKVLRVLLSITATFIALWTPYFILFTIKEVTGLDDTSNFNHWPYVVGRVMTVLSTVTNPLIYLVTKVTLRKEPSTTPSASNAGTDTVTKSTYQVN